MDLAILETIKEKGLLLEKEIYELLECFGSAENVKSFLENLERISGQKFITKKVLRKNFELVQSSIEQLPGDKKKIEKVIVNLGLSLEIQKEVEDDKAESEKQDYRIFYTDTTPYHKLTVKDFTGHFRARYNSIQRILMGRPELQANLTSIGKISSDRTSLAFIGIVSEKRVTKNKNLIIKFEDLTGEINGLVKMESEIFSKGEELQLDEVVGIRGSGNREMVFVHDIFFPDTFLAEKTLFDEDISVGFLSDLHVGSNRHLTKSFENFLKWVNESEEAKKIKYLFFTGDNVDGVGVFPGQEDSLDLKDMHSQYNLLVDYLRRIPKRITLFMCPGQHDAVRVAEPQPLISKKYAPGLYELDNLVLVTNPCVVKLLEGKKEFKVLMYHGASIHGFINEIKELRDAKAHTCPAMAVKHMLKRRHLAPTHSSVSYIPSSEGDGLFIAEVPNVITTGEVHKVDIEKYNGVTIVACSCWQAQTSFEEKVGNVPDPCKVPVINLKTGGIKILDFREDGEVDEKGVWMGE